MSEAATISELDQDRSAYWQVRPDPLPHTAFARTLTIPDTEDEHGRQEPYDPRSHPGQWHALQAADGIVNGQPAPRRWRRFMLLSDAQGLGKSWLLQQVLFHAVIELGQGVIYALPTRGLAGDIWNLKIRPAIEGAGLGIYLPTVGPGAKGAAAPRSVHFRRVANRGGGPLVFLASGGRGQSGQAGLTSKYLIVDELGDWVKAAFTRIRKRVSKWNDIAIEWYGSTCKLDSNDQAIATHQEGTRTRVEYECPHCHDWTAFDWATWRTSGSTESEVIASASIACLKCGAVIKDEHRTQAMRKHRAIMEDESSSIWSIRCTALDCPWKSLGWLAQEEWRAQTAKNNGDHEPMRTFYHDERVEIYTAEMDEMELGTELSWRFLYDRAHATPFGPARHLTDKGATDDGHTYSRYVCDLPPEANFWVTGVDMQDNRCYWVATAAALDGTTWDIGWGYEMGRSDHRPLEEGERHAMLDRLDAFLMQTFGTLQYAQHGLDTAEEFKGSLFSWLRGRDRTWRATRGQARAMKPGPGDLPGIAVINDGVIHIDTNNVRELITAAYKRPVGTVGACHIPHGLPNTASGTSYLRHLCAERKIMDSKTKKEKVVNGPGRWDYQDARRIAEVMLRFRLAANNRPKPKRKFGSIGNL